jgi:hypothetical protein
MQRTSLAGMARTGVKRGQNNDVRCNFADGTARLRVVETDLPGDGPARAIAGSLCADNAGQDNASKVSLQLIYTCPSRAPNRHSEGQADVTYISERRTILVLQYTSDRYPHGTGSGLSTTLLKALDAMAKSVLGNRFGVGTDKA